MRWVVMLALLAAGCVASNATKPVIEQFTRDVVRVRVPYTASGPQADQAQTAADDMAQRFCDAYGRQAAFASFFHERGNVFGGGAFYFVYRCARP